MVRLVGRGKRMETLTLRENKEETPNPQNKFKLKIKFKLAERKEAKPTPEVVKSKPRRSKNRTNKSTKDDDGFRDDEPLIRIVPSLRRERRNGDVLEDEKVQSGGGDGELGSTTKKGKVKRNSKIKKKRKIEKVDDGDEDGGEEAEEVKSVEDSLYKFPMNRVSRIIKSEILDHKISQEAVFVINRATDQFLELFCREADNARGFSEPKKNIAYNHLSSVVSKRQRFEFLSDFVPEKIRAEDALARRKQPDE